MAKKTGGTVKTQPDKNNPKANRVVETIILDGRLVADTDQGVII